MRRGIGRLRAGGSGAFSPSSISFTSGLWLDQSDMSTGFQDTGAVTPITASGQTVGRRNDKSGRANNVLQAAAISRPEFDIISSIYSDFQDGIDDGYATAGFVAGTLTSDMDCFIAIKRSTSAKAVVVSDAAGAAFFSAMDSAGAGLSYSNAGTPTQFVNNVAVPGGSASTQIQLEAAVTAGSWVVYEARDLNLSTWTAVRIGLFSGYPFPGDIGGFILCPAQSTANRNSLRKWLGAKVGLSL